MNQIYCCPNCGLIYRNGREGLICSDCNVLTFDTGYSEDEWYAMPREKREEEKANLLNPLYEHEKEKELKKQEYARSFNDLYEYDVVTVVNKNNGIVDAEAMKKTLTSYASKGWKLHTMYSNELGKNALAILGIGINTTVCQDVMIFERRVSHLD